MLEQLLTYFCVILVFFFFFSPYFGSVSPQYHLGAIILLAFSAIVPKIFITSSTIRIELLLHKISHALSH